MACEGTSIGPWSARDETLSWVKSKVPCQLRKEGRLDGKGAEVERVYCMPEAYLLPEFRIQQGCEQSKYLPIFFNCMWLSIAHAEALF